MKASEMTYEEFKVEYERLFHAAMRYSPEQAGFSDYTEKMAYLAERYPEFEKRLEDELGV